MSDNLKEIFLKESEIEIIVQSLYQNMLDLQKIKQNVFMESSQVQDIIDKVHSIYKKLVATQDDE